MEPESVEGVELSTPKRPKKLWAKRSYLTADILLSLGFCFGSIPVFWNRKELRMQVSESRFHKLRWTSTILFASTLQALLIIVYLKDLYFFGDPVSFISKNAIHTGYAVVSVFTILFHFHTAWKYEEFANFINKAAAYYESFQSEFKRIVIFVCVCSF
jgi:hypothetical protein